MSQTIELTIRGKWPTPVTVNSVTSADAQFRLTADGCSGRVLNMDDECSVAVTFAPIKAGDASVELSLRFAADCIDRATSPCAFTDADLGQPKKNFEMSQLADGRWHIEWHTGVLKDEAGAIKLAGTGTV